MTIKVIVAEDKKDVIERLLSLFEEVLPVILAKEKFVKVGLSGGSAVDILAGVFARLQTDWSRWRFFFCDERLVPFEDPESTYGAYKKTLGDDFFSKLVDPDQFVTVNPSLKPAAAAEDYTLKLLQYFPEGKLPVFDFLILGMGPDGHTCSLFPNHPLLQASEKVWVAAIEDSPKPPPCRITFTLPVLNAARLVCFAVTGESKADIVEKVLQGPPDIPDRPVSMVRPVSGDLYWIIDKPAARTYLKKL